MSFKHKAKYHKGTEVPICAHWQNQGHEPSGETKTPVADEQYREDHESDDSDTSGSGSSSKDKECVIKAEKMEEGSDEAQQTEVENEEDDVEERDKDSDEEEDMLLFGQAVQMVSQKRNSAERLEHSDFVETPKRMDKIKCVCTAVKRALCLDNTLQTSEILSCSTAAEGTAGSCTLIPRTNAVSCGHRKNDDRSRVKALAKPEYFYSCDNTHCHDSRKRLSAMDLILDGYKLLPGITRYECNRCRAGQLNATV
jgi:hypothetical protein